MGLAWFLADRTHTSMHSTATHTRSARARNYKATLAQVARRAIEPLEARTLFATYNVVDLGTLGGATADGIGVNATGQAAVTADLPADSTGFSSTRASIYSGGSLTDVGTFGGPDGVAAGINAAGHLAGSAADANGAFDAFYWDGSSLTNLGSLGGSFSVATGINDSNVVVGSSQVGDDTGPEHGFVWQNGTMTDIGSLGDVSFDYSKANAINSAGQIAGESGVSDSGETHAFLRSGTTLTDLGVLAGGDFSTGLGINSAGNVVGNSSTTINGVETTRAFLWNGTLTGLGVLSGDSFSGADAINTAGDVVGYSATDADLDGSKAFVMVHGTAMTDLNTLIPSGSGWQLTEARSINDAGQIIGVGTLNGNMRAFLLTPTSGGGGGGGDTTPPTASVATPAPALGAATATISVTYTDETAVNAATIDVGDIQVSGPGGALSVASVSISPSANAASIVATYTVNAIGGTWDSADDGSYTATVFSGQVLDTSGNAAATTSTPFTVAFNSAVGPSAAITPVADITTAGAVSGSITVTYADTDNVSFASLGTDDVTISGGGSVALPITSFAAVPTADASSVAVTYTFTPPGGSWDALDDGQYTISVDGSSILDAVGNPGSSASATFNVNIPIEVPTLDPTFNSASPVNAGFVAEASVADLDGRIYVAGHSGSLTDGTSVGEVKRYHPDGSIDATFGKAGTMATAAGVNDAYYNIALDPAGKLVVVSGARGADFVAARYSTKNGKLDGTFGVHGAALLDLGGTEAAYGLAVGPDSSVYIGGSTAGGVAFVKFNRKGRLDTTFGPGGSVILPAAASGSIDSLVLQPNGFIVGAGDLDGVVFVTRLATDGSIDPGFNGGTVQTLTALATRTDLGGPDTTVGLALQADGKILVANRTSSGDFGVARLDTAGALDATFGDGDGVATADLGGSDDDADQVLVQGTGQIFLVGTSNAGGGVSTAIAAFDSAGALDTNFDDDGLFTVAGAITDPATSLVLSGQNVRATGVLQADGKLVTVTSSNSPTSGSGLRRLNMPGSGSVGAFGVVNGKRKNLAFTDSDGTKITISLKTGTATAFYDGTNLEMTLTGTTIKSSLSIAGKGGDGRVRLGDVHTDGALGTFSAKTSDLRGTLYVNGGLSKLDVGTVSGVVAAAGSISSANFRGDLAGAKILAGANLGADALIGGGDDVYSAAFLSKIAVAGAVAASVVGAGFDPVDGDFFNGGTVAGGVASYMKSISVKRAVDGASRFFAGAFKTIKAPQKVVPGTDERFQVL